MNLKRFCCDLAIMEYGPAIQISIGSISLTDSLHICKNNESVQLFSITSNCLVQESINLLYRKVHNCQFQYNVKLLNLLQYYYLGKSRLS